MSTSSTTWALADGQKTLRRLVAQENCPAVPLVRSSLAAARREPVSDTSSAPAITSVTRNGDNVTVTFAESVTVKGQPSLVLTDGKTAAYQSGSGTATLAFRAVSSAPPARIALNGGAILASQASPSLRVVADALPLAGRPFN